MEQTLFKSSHSLTIPETTTGDESYPYYLWPLNTNIHEESVDLEYVGNSAMGFNYLEEQFGADYVFAPPQIDQLGHIFPTQDCKPEFLLGRFPEDLQYGESESTKTSTKPPPIYLPPSTTSNTIPTFNHQCSSSIDQGVAVSESIDRPRQQRYSYVCMLRQKSGASRPCGKKFSLEQQALSKFVAHLVTHLKPYQCGICFFRAGTLFNHKRHQHTCSGRNCGNFSPTDGRRKAPRQRHVLGKSWKRLVWQLQSLKEDQKFLPTQRVEKLNYRRNIYQVALELAKRLEDMPECTDGANYHSFIKV